MFNLYSNLRKLYPVQKTLRFELIPQGKTKENMEKEGIKGEYVILLDLNDNEQEDCSKKEMPLEEQYEYYEKKGLEKKEIIKQIAKDRNTNKNEIYQKFLKK